MGEEVEDQIEETYTLNQSDRKEEEKSQKLLIHQENDTKLQQFWKAVFVSYTVLSAGLCIGYTSSALPSMAEDFVTFPGLSHHQSSWIGGLNPLGALAGSVLSAIPIRYFGTKKTINFIAAPLLSLSWATIAFSPSVKWVFVGRVLGGAGSGMAICSAPLYIIENVSDRFRGQLGIIPQFLLVFGIWFSNLLGSGLHWRPLAFASCMLSLPGMVLPLTVLEQKPERSKTRKTSSSSTKMDPYRESKLVFLQPPKADQDSFQDFVKPMRVRRKTWNLSTVKACAVALGIMSFQQLTGINGVTFYSVTIFKETPGVNTLGPYVPAIFLATTQCIAIFISTIYVERSGRKLLLMLSGVCLTSSAGLLSLYFYFCSGPKLTNGYCGYLQVVPLILLITFAFGFAIGFGPVSWILVGEILPSNVRNVMNPLTIGYSWFCIFLVTKSFPVLMVDIHLWGVFALFFSIGLVSIFFIKFCVPETKGKTLAEIQKCFGISTTV